MESIRKRNTELVEFLSNQAEKDQQQANYFPEISVNRSDWCILAGNEKMIVWDFLNHCFANNNKDTLTMVNHYSITYNSNHNINE